MIGRYHRVRPIGPHGIGAPYVWDRGRAQDTPRLIPAPYDKGETFKGFTRYGEWWRSPEGIWTPAIRGGAGGTYMSGSYELPRMTLIRQAGAAQSTLALDSNYVYNSTGDAIASRLVVPATSTLATVYFFVTGYTGTAANVNDLNLELRDNSVTVGPGTTLHESKTVNPSSATGWVASTGWTFSLVAGTQYWLILGDADGNGTDLATVLANVNAWNTILEFATMMSVTTSDGWASVRTFAGRTPSLVFVLADGRVGGQPFSSTAAPSSSTNQRGLRFVAPAGMKLFGMISNSANAGFSGVNLWSGSNGPSGSADANGTIALPATAVAGVDQGFAFGTPPSLTQGTTYRLVFTYSTNTALPNRLLVGTGADATLCSAMLGGGAWYWTEANGTSDWSNDNTSEFPAVDVIVEDFVTAGGGGGGGFAGVLGE